MNEAAILQNLRGSTGTLIFATHRIGTMRHASRIVSLDSGRIMESGTHDELMAAGGLYAKLVASSQGTVL